MSEKWIVGLNHGGHDAAAALIYGSKIVAVAEEERFTKIKRAIGQAPINSLKWCLDYAGITLGDVDTVALGSDHERLARWLGISYAEYRDRYHYDDPNRLFPKDIFGRAGDDIVMMAVPHHEAHAASAFWPSGSERAAVLVVDNRGEDTSTTFYEGDREKGLRKLREFPVDSSLGLFYRIATQYTGLYQKTGAAGKLMGLASYGRPDINMPMAYVDGAPTWAINSNSELDGDNFIGVQTERLLNFFEKNYYPYRRGLKADIFAYANFAATAQTALESVMMALITDLKKRLPQIDQLCLAGGVALNCSANGRIASSKVFEHTFIQPMAGDAGVALGAALFAAHKKGENMRLAAPMISTSLGLEESNEEIEWILKNEGINYRRLTGICETAQLAAKAVAEGRVIAWHQGRAEVGPRALGNRSFIGDPRRRETHVLLNEIKEREMWRPIAPSVLAERFYEYFEGEPNPFMIVAATVRSGVRSRIPAVVHIDGSARPQCVAQETNPRYYALLKEFYKITGVPLVTNTSLNVAGMPLANNAADTIQILRARNLVSAAFIGDFMVTR